MAYNSKNHLLQAQKVLDIYLAHKKYGVSTVYVWKTYIYPVYPISIATLYNYLNTPVSKKLKEIDAKAQLQLF